MYSQSTYYFLMSASLRCLSILRCLSYHERVELALGGVVGRAGGKGGSSIRAGGGEVGGVWSICVNGGEVGGESAGPSVQGGVWGGDVGGVEGLKM
jgi:hypothetical protein